MDDWLEKMKKKGEYGTEHIIIAFSKMYPKLQIAVFDKNLDIPKNEQLENIIKQRLIIYLDGKDCSKNILQPDNALILIFTGDEIEGHYELAVPE